MAVADEAEGWAEAQRRIAACRETRSERLDLSNLGLTRVPQELMELDWLQQLDLKNDRWMTRSVGIGAEGVGALSGLVALTRLNPSANWIGAEGARALSGLVNLTTLNLSGNEIGDDGARALSGLVNLTTLELGSNDIGAEGARALSVLANLTTLDLSGNWIGDDGAQALSVLANLTTLELRDNDIGDEGARALSVLVNLTTLELGSNGIGAEGAGALSGLVNLTTLSLASNEIGDEGARALSGLVHLTTLDLSSNGLTDLSPLFHLVSLRKLDCSQCRLERTQPEFWDMPSLQEVILYETELPGVPKEVLSPYRGESCLDTLRAHFRNIGERPSGRAVDARRNVSAFAKVEVIAPAPKGSAITEYYVSYAWGDATPEGQGREAIVEHLCAQAQSRGRAIIRDKTAMRHGDRISKFMKRIAGGDRIFIVLSDKYLKSAYCMHELFDVWRNCREDDAEFIERTRVFILPCAKIVTLRQRTQYVVHWKKRFEETEALVKEFGLAILGAADLDDYRWMSDFANKTADMLRLVQDVLRPRSFDEFATYGFDDPPR